MSIELQIQSSILVELIARTTQAGLRAACFPSIASLYVDHADVAATPQLVSTKNGTVRFHVPIDVFVVRREDVLAAPNAVPTGATASAGTIVLVLEMGVSGAVVSLQSVDVELGLFGAALGASSAAAKAAILGAVSSPVKADLTDALTQLGVPVPSSSRVDLIGNIVAIRLDPTGNGAEHLFPGQEWGLFIDGASVEQLVMSNVPNRLRSSIPWLSFAAHWRPAGSVPHVDIDFSGKVLMPDPFTASVDVTLGCDLSLTPTITKSLRIAIHWSFHINLGDLVPGFVDNTVETIVEYFVEDAFDPTKFGGIPIGDHTFTLDRPLPNIPFGEARFAYASIEASVAGMTIGGTVSLPVNPGKDTVQLSVHPLGLPYSLFSCRILAESGSGAPPKTVSLSEVSTSGRVWLENCGRFCNAEIVSPGDWIGPYFTWPSQGAAESQEIKVAIPSLVALAIVKSVRLIVHTARGVRLVDLGIPPQAQVDANGNVTNALIDYINDCLTVVPEDYGIDWGKGVSDLTPPLEQPDWTKYLVAQRGIEVQLVTLSGLEPGELIQFRSRDHAVDVTAGRNLAPPRCFFTRT